jgi:hypothetical protein
MPALSRRPIPLRWLPPVIFVGLILVMGVGLFGLTRLQDSQVASTSSAP